MAKRKRSTALFEVISKSRQYRPARPATSRSGNWLRSATSWFMRPKFQAIVPAGQIGHITRGVVSAQEMDYDEPQVTLTDPDEAHLATTVAAPPEPEPVTAPVEIVKYEAPPSATHRDIAVPATAAPHPASPTQPKDVQVAVDPDRRQIALKMSYTAAAAIGMGLMAVVCGAVIIGQRLNRSTLPMLAQTSTEELRKGPAHREVLDPPRKASVPARITAVEARVSPRTTPREPEARPAAAAQIAQSNASADKRVAGYNYVVVQSYPPQEQEMAEKTAAFLNSHGVSCTLERSVKGFLPVCVVGLDGFSKISSSEYKSYVEHIKKLGAEFTSNSRSFKSFDPRAKKW
jgi:hypothetical protein